MLSVHYRTNLGSISDSAVREKYGCWTSGRICAETYGSE